jgi:hypothetical protein
MIENLKKIGQMQPPPSRKQSETVQLGRNQRRKESGEKATKEDWVKLCQTLNGLPDDLQDEVCFLHCKPMMSYQVPNTFLILETNFSYHLSM